MSNKSATLVKPQVQSQQATAPKPPAWASALRIAVWSTLSAAAILGIVEGLFAFAGIGEEEFVDAQPIVGFWHMPNKKVTWRSEGYAQDTTSNDGLRDINFPIQKPAGVKRIAFTGDSMVEGYQVESNQTFVKQLAERLTKESGIKAEGMNFGMSGFSTMQELYTFKEKMLKYQPDVLVLSYHIGDNEKNEYQPAPGGFMPRPYAKLTADGHLQTDWRGYDMWMFGPMHQQFDSMRWLRANSRIWGVWTKLDLQLADVKWYANIKKFLDRTPKSEKQPDRFTSTANDFGLDDDAIDTNFAYLPKANWLYQPISKELDPKVQAWVAKNRDVSAGWRAVLKNGNERFAMTGAIIDTLNRACRKANCKLVVAALPAPSNSLLYKRELHMMKKLAWQSDLTFINLNDEIPQIAPMQENDIYYVVHFRPHGQQLVTNILFDHFKKDGVIDFLKK